MFFRPMFFFINCFSKLTLSIPEYPGNSPPQTGVVWLPTQGHGAHTLGAAAQIYKVEMMYSSLSDNLFGIVRHNLWDLTLIFRVQKEAQTG